MSRMTILAVVAVFLCTAAPGVCGWIGLQGYQMTLTPVSGLPTVTSMNNSGQILGSINSSSAPAKTFLWSTMTGELKYSGGTGYQTAFGINEAGDIVGKDGRSPLAWFGSDIAQSAVRLPSVPPATSGGSVPFGGCARAINSRRQIVGSAPGWYGYWDSTERASTWNPRFDDEWNAPVRLGVIADTTDTAANATKWDWDGDRLHPRAKTQFTESMPSAAYDVNEQGMAAGWAYDVKGRCRPVIWDTQNPGKIARVLNDDAFDIHGAAQVRAKAIDYWGDVVGSAVFGDKEVPVEWFDDGINMRVLMVPWGLGSASTEDINDSGLMVGNSAAGATIWDVDGWAYALPHPEGIVQTWAYAINNNGQIAGVGGDGAGNWYCMLWNPGDGPTPIWLPAGPSTPEPGTLAAVALPSLALFVHRLRKRPRTLPHIWGISDINRRIF